MRMLRPWSPQWGWHSWHLLSAPCVPATFCVPMTAMWVGGRVPILQKTWTQMPCSVQLLSPVQLPATPRTAAHQASLSITNFQSLLKLMSIKSMMPFNHFILCHPLLLLSIFPSIRVFSIESVLHIRWPKHWSFSFSISPPNEYSGLISFRIDWFDLLCPRQQREVLTQYCPGTWARGSSPGLRV